MTPEIINQTDLEEAIAIVDRGSKKTGDPLTDAYLENCRPIMEYRHLLALVKEIRRLNGLVGKELKTL